jgi:predicted dehydrogenase
MSALRMAVVGVGHLGRHHARILAGLGGVQLVAVADSRIEQARAIAEPLGVQAVDDFRTLFDQVDAVTIAVPTVLHREVACAFLERGIPCSVEKPLAASLSDATAIVDLARRAGLLLQVGHIERYNPALGVLDGFRVQPKYIAAERLSTYTFRSTDIGVILDLMIHDLDLLLTLVHRPVAAISALGVSVFGHHEDIANARIWFEGGIVADLSASRASYQAVRKMRIWGSEGYATLDFASKQGTVVRPSDRLRRGELDLQGLDLSQPTAVRDHLFGKVLRVDRAQPESRDQLTQELEDFVRAVRTGSRPRVTGEDGLRAIELADQILRCVDTHRWDGTADGPIGPRELPPALAEPIAGLTGPMLWRLKGTRAGSVHKEP